jgi:hypothetical protein
VLDPLALLVRVVLQVRAVEILDLKVRAVLRDLWVRAVLLGLLVLLALRVLWVVPEVLVLLVLLA